MVGKNSVYLVRPLKIMIEKDKFDYELHTELIAQGNIWEIQ